MIKFTDILNETLYEKLDLVDDNIRKILHMIKSLNPGIHDTLNHWVDVNSNRVNKVSYTPFDKSPVFNLIKEFLENTLGIKDGAQQKKIIILYIINSKVDNYLTDPIDFGDNLYLYSIEYTSEEPDELEMSDYIECSRCYGVGHQHVDCDNCDGGGQLTYYDDDDEEYWDDCPECNGEGEHPVECVHCGGEGGFDSEYVEYKLGIHKRDYISNGKIEISEVEWNEKPPIEVLKKYFSNEIFWYWYLENDFADSPDELNYPIDQVIELWGDKLNDDDIMFNL